MKKIYSCYIKIISTYALENNFNTYLNTNNCSRDYSFLDMLSFKDYEILKLKKSVDKYLSKMDVNIDELDEDDLTTINVNEKNREQKKVPKYIYEGKIYCTRTFNPHILKELITGQHFYLAQHTYIPFTVNNFLTIDKKTALDIDLDYDMLKNYLLNEDIIKNNLNLINNHCLNLYEKYKKIYDDKNIKTGAEKKKEIKALIKKLK